MLENGSAQKLVDAGGTPAFMAPELCSSAEAFSGQLADIWAIGATMYMLRFGQPPFVASNVLALYNKILNDPLEFPPVAIDPGLRNLLVNMLEKDPKLRYNMDQITNHPWLRFAPRVAPTAALFAPQPDLKSGKHVLQLPDQYFNEEAEAMKCPQKTVDRDEIYQSIGFGVEKQPNLEDDQEVGGIAGQGADDDEDIMATNWASDVFEQVDDADLDSSDDDSVDDEDEESSPNKVSVPTKVPCGEQVQKMTNMDESEQDRRSKEFKQKLIAKSSATNFLSSGGPLQPKTNSHPGGMKSVDEPSDDETDEDIDIVNGQNKGRVGRQDSLDLGDLVEELSMNDFEDMMDTLAMRPVSKISHPHHPTNEPFLLENVVISSSAVNVRSGLGGIAFSDQGCRRSQEDRPVLVLSFDREDQLAAETGHYDYLLNVSVAAVFDGHSGDACSEYLSKNFVRALLMNQHFYSTKTLKQSMIETCSKVDLQVCVVSLYILN